MRSKKNPSSFGAVMTKPGLGVKLPPPTCYARVKGDACPWNLYTIYILTLVCLVLWLIICLVTWSYVCRFKEYTSIVSQEESVVGHFHSNSRKNINAQ